MGSDRLLLIDIVNAHGVVLLKTIWATTADLVSGHRRTDVERIDDLALLMARIGELVLRIFESTPPAAARKAEGIAAMAADLPPAPAAGDLAAAA